MNILFFSCFHVERFNRRTRQGRGMKERRRVEERGVKASHEHKQGRGEWNGERETKGKRARAKSENRKAQMNILKREQLNVNVKVMRPQNITDFNNCPIHMF